MSAPERSRLPAYLDHILSAIDNIIEYTSGMDAEQYLLDRKTQDAVIRNLEVIGEACSNVMRRHPDFAAAHPAVLWKAAYEMRNAMQGAVRSRVKRRFRPWTPRISGRTAKEAPTNCATESCFAATSIVSSTPAT
jgi:uncharacterized protein with HEPN domain